MSSTIISRKNAPVKPDAQVMGELEEKKIYNTSYTTCPCQDLVYNDDDYSKERRLCKECCDDYGVKPMTKEELDEERALSWAIIKRLTMAVLSMDFTSFSFPVGYSEQRSFLERTADLFTFLADGYATKIVECTDNVKRLQLLTTGVCAGFLTYMQTKKPWNPILGETYVGKWPNGVTIYGEQTSHHPPISDFQVTSPDGTWKCNAHCNFTISSGVMSVDVLQSGIFTLELKDGAKYEWQFPVINVSGVIRGERYVNVKGPITLKDVVNELVSTVEVAPKTGFWSRAKSTILEGKVVDKEGKVLSTFKGDYTQSFTVDDVEVWNIDKDIAHRPITKINDDELLPSDCRFRLDRYYLINKKMDLADQAKVIMEESQRREEKLRVLVPKEGEEVQETEETNTAE